MTHLGATRTPKRICRAVGKFYRVERVLYPLIHAIQRDGFLVRHADIDVKQRLRAEIFRHLQILIKTQSLRGVIFPDVPQRRARINVTNRIFPMIHVREIIALDPAAAGKTQKFRMQRV